MLLIPLIEMKLFLGNLINSDQRDGEKSKKLSIYWVNRKWESNHVTIYPVDMYCCPHWLGITTSQIIHIEAIYGDRIKYIYWVRSP